MSKIFAYFIERWRLAFAMTSICLVIGVTGSLGLNREQFPPLNTGNIVVTTLYPGASSNEVSDNVTRLLEDEIRAVDGLKDTTSVSRSGLSRVIIRTDIDNYDVESVFQEVQKAVDKAGPLPEDLPDDPEVEAIKSAEIPILKMALTGPNTDRRRDLLAEDLQDRLEFLNGVAGVNLIGHSKREFQVLLDKQKLANRQVSVKDVSRAIQHSVQNIPAGDIQTNGLRKLVRMKGKVKTAAELESIIVRSNLEGGQVRVRDVARVIDAEEDRHYAVSFNGEPATTLTVIKKSAADAIETLDAIHPELEAMRAKLPQGYSLAIYENEAEQVKTRLGIVISNALFGMVLVLVALLIFFPGRAGYVTALSLPIAILFTVGLMPFFDTGFNTITMMALVVALGLMVDNSIVISENYIRLREEGLPQLEAAQTAVQQFWLPITATALTTIAAFFPMFLTAGIMGEVVQFIPTVITIAICASLLESFMLLPARLRFTLSEKSHGATMEKSARWFSGVERRFENLIRFCLKRRGLTVLAVAGLVFGSISLNVLFNYFEVFPREKVEVYLAKVEGREGVTLEKTLKEAGAYAERIRAEVGDDNIENIIVTVGDTQSSQIDTYARFGEHTGRVRVVLKQKFAWAQQTEEFLVRLRSVDSGEFIAVTFDAIAAGPNVGKALDVTLSSNNEEELLQAVAYFKERLQSYPGVFDVGDDNPPGGQEITFEVQQFLLSSAGLSNQDLGLALRTALEGDVASSVNLDGEEVDIRVKYDSEFRQSIDNVTGTRMSTAGGSLIPVGRVAAVQEEVGVAQVKNYQFRRAVSVSADVDNKNMTAVELTGIAGEIQNEIETKYPGIYFSFLGQAESTNESVSSLLQALLVAALVIFLILVFLFDSYLYPLIILSAIPLGLVGVMLAFLLHVKPISFFALVGIVGLAGVVVNDTIILVSFARLLKKEGRIKSNLDLLARATTGRLKPVLVTTLTTVGGLLPTAYGIGGYDPTLVPLTLAMAWGLMFGTTLTLILTPCLLSFSKEFSLNAGGTGTDGSLGIKQALKQIIRALPNWTRYPTLKTMWDRNGGAHPKTLPD